MQAIFKPENMNKILKLIRLEAGLTQSQLANIVGCSATSISAWESGNRKIRAITLKNIAEKLGYKVSITLEDDK